MRLGRVSSASDGRPRNSARRMRFQLNGAFYKVEPEIARARILGSVPVLATTHWVEIDGRRWPASKRSRWSPEVCDLSATDMT